MAKLPPGSTNHVFPSVRPLSTYSSTCLWSLVNRKRESLHLAPPPADATASRVSNPSNWTVGYQLFLSPTYPPSETWESQEEEKDRRTSG